MPLFKKRLCSLALAGVFSGLAALSGSASAIGLVQAYTEALKNDPTFRSAIYEHRAGQENKALARAGLLPNLAASYSGSHNRTDITSPGLTGLQTTHPAYTSKSANLQLRQTLFNLEGVARYFQAGAQVSYADAQFSARQQDLVIRLVSTYVDAQFAEEQLALVRAQRDAYAEQQNVNQRMFEQGEGTRTDVLEAQSKFDAAQAQVIEAEDNVTNSRNALASIVGMDIESLDPLSESFKIRTLEPSTLAEWKALALAHNAEIDALRYAVEIQQIEIYKNRAAHAPRVDFVSTLSRGDSESINTLYQSSVARSVGVQVNIPIYSGGSVSASTRQSVANTEKARADLEAKTNQVMVEIRKQYSLALSSVGKIDALLKSVNSSQLLVEATRQSIKGGVRINLDLLNAQQQLFAARRDLAQGRYGYLLSYLRLRNAAGVLNGSDLQTVAGYFAMR